MAEKLGTSVSAVSCFALTFHWLLESDIVIVIDSSATPVIVCVHDGELIYHFYWSSLEFGIRASLR